MVSLKTPSFHLFLLELMSAGTLRFILSTQPSSPWPLTQEKSPNLWRMDCGGHPKPHYLTMSSPISGLFRPFPAFSGGVFFKDSLAASPPERPRSGDQNADRTTPPSARKAAPLVALES